MPQWHIGSHISPIPHQLMSSALGLLLVFRTNAAYDRFWEARKVWGSVTNVCRNLARTGRIALDRRYHARFSMLVIAFAVTLRAHLQRTVVSTELEGLLPSWEADQVRIDSCPPALVCMKLTHLINEAVTQNEARSDFYALYLEQLVGELINCLGMAERILLTPVPASYSRHTSRFLSLYTLTLPFVLVHQLEFFTAPALGAICWGLFSMYVLRGVCACGLSLLPPPCLLCVCMHACRGRTLPIHPPTHPPIHLNHSARRSGT